MPTQSEKISFERDFIPSLKLTLWAIGLTVFVVLIVVGVRQVFVVGVRSQIALRTAQYNGTEVRKLRAQQQSDLTTYGIVDADKGVYRIPIDKAIKSLVEDPQRVAGIPPDAKSRPNSITEPAQPTPSPENGE